MLHHFSITVQALIPQYRSNIIVECELTAFIRPAAQDCKKSITGLGDIIDRIKGLWSRSVIRVSNSGELNFPQVTGDGFLKSFASCIRVLDKFDSHPPMDDLFFGHIHV